MIQHKELAEGRWQEMSFCEQMANIGSEVSRTIKWKEKNNPNQSQKAFERALELIDITLTTNLRRTALIELCRLRENLCEEYFKPDTKGIEKINKYLFQFAIASQKRK